MDNYKQDQIFPANVVENTGAGTISKNFVANVFLWMFIALGLSAAFAFLFDGIYARICAHLLFVGVGYVRHNGCHGVYH